MLRLLPLVPALALALTACEDRAPSTPANLDDAVPAGNTGVAAPNGSVPPTPATTELSPPAPGEPGGLPDDRTPISEAPFSPESAQGAANLVQRYAGLLEARKFDQAYAAWGTSGGASGMSAVEFARSFEKYSELHGQVGGPSAIQGSAGSSFVTVPLQLYGRLKTGGTFNLIGPVTLRRVNNVPGASPAQLRWRIEKTDLKAEGVTRETGG